MIDIGDVVEDNTFMRALFYYRLVFFHDDATFAKILLHISHTKHIYYHLLFVGGRKETLTHPERDLFTTIK